MKRRKHTRNRTTKPASRRPKISSRQLHRLKRWLKEEALFEEGVSDSASENGGAWFDRHQDRNYRARPFIPFELPTLPGSTMPTAVLVVQVARGERVRITLSDTPPIDPGEEILREYAEKAPIPLIPAPGHNPPKETIEAYRQRLAEARS